MDDVGVEKVHGRAITLFELSDWTWEERATPSHPFTLLVAADSSRDEYRPPRGSQERRSRVAAATSAHGGVGCEMVHDLFDEASIERSQFVMSTWHDQDPLYEALYYALVLAVPEDVAAADAAVVLAVTDRWLPEVRRLIADQDELARLWVAEEQ